MARRPSIEVVAKRRAALTLRRDGYGYVEIAARLGYKSVSSAHDAVQWALTETLQEPADEVRNIELARLDRLVQAVWPKALDGDLKAADTVVKLMDRRARYLGLDKHTEDQGQGQVDLLAAYLNVSVGSRSYAHTQPDPDPEPDDDDLDDDTDDDDGEGGAGVPVAA